MDKAYAELQCSEADRIAIETEFSMLENINLVVTEHCNLACTYCGTGSPFAKKISHPVTSFVEWLDILEEKRIPFKWISLTGGEPFLHPEVRDGTFIQLLRQRYPSKRVGLTTNFFWASEKRILNYAPVIGMINGGLAISVYEPIVQKLGGVDKYNALVNLLREVCPNTFVSVEDRPVFQAWKFHEEEREVKGPCPTSDCFNLKPDGKLTHCSLAIAVQNIPEYRGILEGSKEALLDVRGLTEIDGRDRFLSWSRKYPFDLCSHCTMWQGKYEPWSQVR